MGQQGQRPNGRIILHAAHRGRGCSLGHGQDVPMQPARPLEKGAM